jgi:antitoxin HicB
MKPLEYYLSLNYRSSVYRDDEGDFIVEVPDLPGCAADGKTPDEAFNNLKSAMRSWIESRAAAGLEIPEPRSAEEYSGRLVIRMPKYLHERLSHQAGNEGVSLNQYMVSLLSEASVTSQAREAHAVSSANVVNLWGGTAFSDPQFGAINPVRCNYVTYNCDSLTGETWQGILTNRAGLPRISVSQESQKEPVLKPQLVPKQQVA